MGRRIKAKSALNQIKLKISAISYRATIQAFCIPAGSRLEYSKALHFLFYDF